jgi:hypothetical protein
MLYKRGMILQNYHCKVAMRIITSPTQVMARYKITPAHICSIIHFPRQRQDKVQLIPLTSNNHSHNSAPKPVFPKAIRIFKSSKSKEVAHRLRVTNTFLLITLGHRQVLPIATLIIQRRLRICSKLGSVRRLVIQVRHISNISVSFYD